MIGRRLEDEIQNLLLVALESGADAAELHAIVDDAVSFLARAQEEIVRRNI